jgi:glycerophosphoryl diester phosphodiesterase
MLAPLSYWPQTRPLVIAHRGRCSVAGPENTTAGAAAALDAGCDGVEVDVRRTEDGELVLMHDPTPMRTTFARGAEGELARRRPVETSCLAELRTLGVRTPDGVEHPEWLVPLLSEVLRLALQRGAAVVIDVKEPRPVSLLWSSLVDELRQLPMGCRERVVVQSASAGALLVLRRALPEISTSQMSWGPVHATPDEGGPSIRSRPWWTAFAPTIVRDHAKRRRVLAWTVNTKHQMLDLMSRGVDGIIPDEPLVLLDLIGSTDRFPRRPGAAARVPRSTAVAETRASA